MDQKKQYFIFARSPFSQLDKFVDTEQERDRIIAAHKAVFPEVPVYWTVVYQS